VPDVLPGPGCRGLEQAERRRPAAIGQQLGWTLAGPRRCCGIWTGLARRPCPLGSLLEDSTDPQCRPCAAADPGRALARDAAGDDGRAYGLYLAWFGPGLLKIGLTAAERGRDRLLEQGAIAYLMLASGSYAGIRRAERMVSLAGLARERIPARAKASAWPNLPGAYDRAAALTTAQARIREQLTWPAGTTLAAEPVIDQAADFGLDRPVPDTWDEVTAIASGARVAGKLAAIVGRHILLDAEPGPLLLDMRRVAGWALARSADTAGAGLTTIPRTRPQEARDDQRTLF
jgi:Protein of unknown function (DUF2797)